MKIRPHGDKWRADAGLVLGRRRQKVFASKREAELWLRGEEKIRTDMRLGIRRISSAREQLAAVAFNHLEKVGLKDEDLVDAVRRFCAVSAPSTEKGLKEAMVAFELDLRFGNRSPVYIEQLMYKLNRFYRDFALRKVQNILPDDIKDWLQQNCETASNRANRRRELRVFFSWAVRQGLVSENPVDRIPRIAVDRGRPDVLTIDQVRSALRNLDGQDRALFAIMTFAGLRPSEAEALHWEDIKLDRGFLEAKRGFRADNRNVRLSANLIAWLTPRPKSMPAVMDGNEVVLHFLNTGLVFKGHTRRWRDRVQRAIAQEAEPLPRWPQDVLRHTFGSYHLEAFKNAVETAHEMGHRGNTRMLFSHYRDLVTPEAAKAFWEIMP